MKHCSIIKADPEGVGPVSELVSFFDPETVGQALHESGWGMEEMLGTLAQIARDADNYSARERMAAMKMIDDKGREALSLAGIIQRISLEASTEKDGVRKTLTEDGLKLIRDGSARTLSTLELLEAGSQTPEVIDVNAEEVPDDARAGSDVQTTSRPSLPAPGSGPSGSSESGPGGSGGCSGTRSGDEPSVHGSERTSETSPTRTGQDNDQDTTGGAKDERGSGIPVQCGRSNPGEKPGDVNVPGEREYRAAGPDDGTTGTKQATCSTRTTPYTPGESRRRAARARDVVSAPRSDSGPTIQDGRPPDGADSKRPRIKARILTSAEAADA